MKVHLARLRVCDAVWAAGAMFGGTDVLLTRSLSREKYLETGLLADWCSLAAPAPAQTRGV